MNSNSDEGEGEDEGDDPDANITTQDDNEQVDTLDNQTNKLSMLDDPINNNV